MILKIVVAGVVVIAFLVVAYVMGVKSTLPKKEKEKKPKDDGNEPSEKGGFKEFSRDINNAQALYDSICEYVGKAYFRFIDIDGINTVVGLVVAIAKQKETRYNNNITKEYIECATGKEKRDCVLSGMLIKYVGIKNMEYVSHAKADALIEHFATVTISLMGVEDLLLESSKNKLDELCLEFLNAMSELYDSLKIKNQSVIDDKIATFNSTTEKTLEETKKLISDFREGNTEGELK